jgi:hypothetical protein
MNIAWAPVVHYEMAIQKRPSLMPDDHLSPFSADDTQATGIFDDIRAFDTSRSELPRAGAANSGLLAADRDKLERDIAAIERASAALRRAEPGLESWSETPATILHNPRPLWLLIGVLWLSTALVTLGAVFAITAIVG